MSKCLFEAKTGYTECKQIACLNDHMAGCCAVCFNKDYCRSMCLWVQDLREKDQELRKARRAK